MAERDGAWIADATIAGGVDPNKDTHPLNCDVNGTLEVVGIVSVIPAAITPISIDQTGTNNNVKVVNGPGTAAVNIQDVATFSYTIRAESDGNSLLIYVGYAVPGALTSASSWRISKLTYDGNGNFASLIWPSADTSFSFIWDNRTTYTYS
jgi:hypothetical protein